jgi:uncharacterized membrane protein
MNWFLVLAILALVLFILQAFFVFFVPAPTRQPPHLGWLGAAAAMGAFLALHHG